MFNLEQALANWRRQMLAAGITAPVPLEELELHLRDEIEQQIRLGVGEEKAFNAAVERMGQAPAIQNEFNKVDRGRKLARVLALSVGWLAASFTLYCCVVCLQLDWNLFSFHPRLDRAAGTEILVILIAVAAFWFLARASRDKVSRAVSLVICMGMASCVWGTFPPEKLEPVQVSPGKGEMHAVAEAIIHQALDRHEPSPLWFRGGLSLPWCLPGVFWIWWLWRDLAEKRRSMQGPGRCHPMTL